MQDIEKKIDEVLSRGVGEFIDPDGSFRQKLIDKNTGKYDKDIVIKYGVDPTRPDIHLGHAVCFRKLREFQNLGCKVIFLVGDFTAMIGDPTGKSKVRPELDQQEVEKNVITYLKQIDKILTVEKDNAGNILHGHNFSWIRNMDWYASPADVDVARQIGKENLANVKSVIEKDGVQIEDNPNSLVSKAILLQNTRMQNVFLKKPETQFITLINLMFNLRHITHSRLIERDMFQDRIDKSEPLYMHEMLYPVLQGVDSIALAKIYGSCDLEVGGTDQTFNMLVGRDLMSKETPKMTEQSVLAFKLLEGTDGKEKMSKSLGNYIGITEEPNSMFLKVMSLPDTSIMNYFELCTDLSMEEIAKIAEDIVTGGNVRAIKMRLAQEIVTMYHSASASEDAKKFYETKSAGEIPENVSPSQGPPAQLSEFIFNQGFATSKSDARRKIEQGGVEIDGERILDWQYEVGTKDNGKVMSVGKNYMVRIVFND